MKSASGSKNWFQAPRVGLEPTTNRLTAGCSTIELSGNPQCAVAGSTIANVFSFIICAWSLSKSSLNLQPSRGAQHLCDLPPSKRLLVLGQPSSTVIG